MAEEGGEILRAKGRGTSSNPASRFLSVIREDDFEQLEFDEEFLEGLKRPKTVYLDDRSKTVISQNDSPDIPFRYSLNPYRGCLHGCSYCYARPTHEYLGLSAGLDFETRIFVKRDAAELFRDFLGRPGWVCESIMMSGVTDCYQPVERHLQLTRGCLQVAREACQPVSLITKNALILRDLDLLSELAQLGLCRVAISLNSLDQSLSRVLEPACSAPTARLDAMRQLSAAGIPVHLMAAPVIPGLNDSELPAVLRAAADVGVKSAGYIMVRLPLTVEPLFLEWLREHRPLMAEKVESRLRLVRGGKLSSGTFHERMRGTGEYAEHVGALFKLHRRKCGLETQLPPLRTDLFHPPRTSRGQQFLF